MDELNSVIETAVNQAVIRTTEKLLYYKDKQTLAREYYHVTLRTLQNKPWMVPDHGQKGSGWSLEVVNEWNRRSIDERKEEYQRYFLNR